MTIGEKIRQLREERNFNRTDFCDTQEELSIRQLIRIEQGQSVPSISSLEYIANRLGVPSYQLMPDYQELPARYKELKYKILRQPAYGSRELLEQQEILIDEIITDFYDDLSADERFTIDCMSAMTQIYLSEDATYGLGVVEENIDKMFEKKLLSVNDLSFLRLLASTYYHSKTPLPPKYGLTLETLFIRLLEQKNLFALDELYIYMNSLLAGLGYFNFVGNYSLFPKGISLLVDIIEETQDFQKKPLISMLEWKVSLFRDKDISQATDKYQEAKAVADLLNIKAMIAGLEFEWKEDLEKFAHR